MFHEAIQKIKLARFMDDNVYTSVVILSLFILQKSCSWSRVNAVKVSNWIFSFLTGFGNKKPSAFVISHSLNSLDALLKVKFKFPSIRGLRLERISDLLKCTSFKKSCHVYLQRLLRRKKYF